MNFKFMALITVFTFCFASCMMFNHKPEQKNSEQQKTKDIYSMADGSVLKVKLGDKELSLVVANSPTAKAQGLSGKNQIPEDGMIFFFYELDTLYFWMKDMNFPIDILWLNGNKVIGIEKNVPIPVEHTKDTDLIVYKSNDKANTVIELEAGAADKLNIIPGSILIIE